ncbi:MAG: LptF/LptG family permease, partial [Bacteroidota bacterium]|nr:LptF/LptG family permease [Bacteroidota bacterium]
SAASTAAKIAFPAPSSPVPQAESKSTSGDTVSALFRALSELRQAQAYAAADAGANSYDTKQMNAYLVEIYKKYSIPVACFVFVFIGAPLGMMARRGGFGVGAGMSLGFFLFYWACLIGGEKLADRGVLSPFVGMWSANIILGLCGAFLTVRTARETTVIDWTRLARFLPRTWRPAEETRHRNPHEA